MAFALPEGLYPAHNTSSEQRTKSFLALALDVSRTIEIAPKPHGPSSLGRGLR